MKISELFKDFAHALEIDKPTIDEAVRLHERARAALEANLEGCKRTTLSGSYPRNTRLAPLDDIDIIAVVKSTAPWDDDPETALRAAGQIVVDEFPARQWRLATTRPRSATSTRASRVSISTSSSATRSGRAPS